MPQDPEKFDPKGAPLPATPADTSSGSRTHPLHHKTHQERLAYWDEWNDRDRERMAQDPQAGPALQHLQRVEAWLHESLLAAQGCPEPEALFALAGPQAAEEFDEAQREELRAHIAICPSCEAEVQSLTTPPPSPLLLSEADWDMPAFLQEAMERPEKVEPSEPEGAAPLAPVLRGPTPWRAWVASAAAVALVWFLAAREGTQVSANGPWPEVATLRSGTAGSPSTPRGRVLARSPQGHWSGVLETAEVEGAHAYLLRLYAHDGSAFDQGERVGQWTQTKPRWTPPAPLPPGHYTAEFAALRDGLEVPLPASEFEVRPSPATLEHLDSLRGVARVRYLYANGWHADARWEAQQLPASAERDEFLNALQQR